MKQDFYATVLSRSNLDTDASILVVCGGAYDRDALLQSGCKNVTISNLGAADDCAPYQWLNLDAEDLALADKSFDWVIVHGGLHHCASPHKALCEMLRVSRFGIIAIEARDSFLVRAAVKMGLTSNYEIEPAALSGASAATSTGGLRNGFIPNYIYRWTEREVHKTVASYLPQYQHKFEFLYGLLIPVRRAAMVRNPVKRAAIMALCLIASVIEIVAPRQGNRFAFKVTKAVGMQPWLKSETELDGSYFDRTYSPSRYR